MLEQPVRVVGLALACALATATLATVTFVVSSLVLSVLAVLGPVAQASAEAAEDGAVQGVLVSGERTAAGDGCRAVLRAAARADRTPPARCAGQRGAGGRSRP